MITPSFGLTATERVLPQMALDFTTASLDSRVTFTRVGATATVVNSSGVVVAADADTPRFDFNPTTLICKGLLIEESRTNLFTFSGDFTNVVWTPSDGAVSSETVTNPDGSTSGALFTENNATAIHTVSRAFAFTSGTAYSYSVFVKTNGRDVIEVGAGNTGTWAARVRFNIATGQILASTGTGTITEYPNGWYRCTVAGTAGATAATTANVRGYSLAAASATYTGDGVSGFYLFGGDFQVGAFPTSYIPTTTLSVTRNADVAVMTSTNFSSWYTATTGAAVVWAIPQTATGTRPLLQFDDTTANEIISLRGNVANPEMSIVDGGAPQAQIDAGTIVANTAYKLSGAWNTDSCAAAKDGAAAVTDNTATIPTPTQLRIGSDGTNYASAWVQKILYYPQRLINAEVQAISK